MLSFKQFSEHPKQSFKAWPDPTRKTLFVPCCRGQSVERYGKESFEKSDKKMETKPSEQNPHQNFLRETLALIRAKNSIMVGFAVLVGIAVASHDPTRLVSRVALLGFLTGFTISSFSMISNDIYDIEVDKLNQPDRPLPSGRVSKKQAWAVAFAFLAVGACCSALTGLVDFLIASVFALIAWVYNWRIKKYGVAGNCLVALSIAIPYVYGTVSIGSYGINLTYFLALTSFLAGVGREVLKGISDVRGDALRKIRSVALAQGKKFAARLSSFFFLVAVISSLFPLLYARAMLGQGIYLYSILIAIPDAIFLYLSVKVPGMVRGDEERQALRFKGIALVGMLTGLLAYLAAGLAI
jgi:geranylgeranylglycerol-phosphate geranylgeranyltransferase